MTEEQAEKEIKTPEQVSQEVREFFEEEQQIEEEESRKKVAQAAEEASISVRRKAINSADIIGMVKSEEGSVMDWMYSTLPPQNSQVEVNPAGGPKKGGGASKSRKKDKKGNKAYMDPWTGI